MQFFFVAVALAAVAVDAKPYHIGFTGVHTGYNGYAGYAGYGGYGGYPSMYYGKREAEAEPEADPQYLYGSHVLPTVTGVAHTVAGVPSVRTLAAVPAVHSVATAAVHAPVTTAAVHASVAVPAVRTIVPSYRAVVPAVHSNVVPAIHHNTVVAPSTVYSSLTGHYYGKRSAEAEPEAEADAEADPQIFYNNGVIASHVPAVSTYTHSVAAVPAVRTVAAVPAVRNVAAAPAFHTVAAAPVRTIAAPIVRSYASPIVRTVAAAPAVHHSVVPAVHSTYAAPSVVSSVYGNHYYGKREAEPYTIGQVAAGLPVHNAYATGHPHNVGYTRYVSSPISHLGHIGYTGYNGYHLG